MKEYEIHLEDWTRIFAGDMPAGIYLEIVFRAAFLFVLLVASMRILGKRMAAQLSRNEMAAMVSLAAAIGVPMLTPERGLLPAVIIALVVISISKLFAKLSFNHTDFEKYSIGDISILVENGILNRDAMFSTNLSRERVMAQLRASQINHLGEVKRLYMEATGAFSIIKQPVPSSGLLVLPEYDQEFMNESVDKTDERVCFECGSKSVSTENENQCDNCGSHHFTDAVLTKAQP